MLKSDSLALSTKGNTDIIDITNQVQDKVEKLNIKTGVVTLFVSGSTAGITTVEYEPGLIEDLKELFERLAPRDKAYHHNERWHDENGYAHLCASLLGPSLSVPFVNRKLLLGTWQQIVFVDFDNRPRERKIFLQIIGE